MLQGLSWMLSRVRCSCWLRTRKSEWSNWCGSISDESHRPDAVWTGSDNQHSLLIRWWSNTCGWELIDLTPRHVDYDIQYWNAQLPTTARLDPRLVAYFLLVSKLGLTHDLIVSWPEIGEFNGLSRVRSWSHSIMWPNTAAMFYRLDMGIRTQGFLFIRVFMRHSLLFYKKIAFEKSGSRRRGWTRERKHWFYL